MNAPANKPTILCLSHLAWEEGLFQRPQQVMARMAELGYNVMYAGCVGHKKYRELSTAGKATGKHGRLNYFNLRYSPFARWAEPLRRAMTADRLIARLPRNRGGLVLWVYHPGLFPLSEKFPPHFLVYDVMDRFEAFEKSSGTQVENYLLQFAGLTFTGGRSLQDAALQNFPQNRPPPVCLASGVDISHFSRAAEAGELPPDMRSLARPILGYFGAVDERIDWDLLNLLAERFRMGSIVLIGPVLTSPPSLPSNIHLIGARPYSDLPAYLRGFDVCLLPFRATELVAHISPTKTPEYLAGGKPVVSTMIPDVAADYSDVVDVTADAESFVEACARAITSPRPAAILMAAARHARTWDEIATIMAGHLREALDAR